MKPRNVGTGRQPFGAGLGIALGLLAIGSTPALRAQAPGGGVFIELSQKTEPVIGLPCEGCEGEPPPTTRKRQTPVGKA